MLVAAINLALGGSVVGDSDRDEGGFLDLSRGWKLVEEFEEDGFFDLSSDKNGERFEQHVGMGFSFQSPAGWDATSEGNESGGRIWILGPCARISIHWLEDVGQDPKSCLDQVAKSYRSDSLRLPVLTTERGKTTVDGEDAATLDLYYKYGEYDSVKRMVAWTSPRSGRFFCAAAEVCPQTQDLNLALFDQMLESFSDLSREDYVELVARDSTEDAWGLVLQDVLTSHHYTESAAECQPNVKVELDFKMYRPGDGNDQIISEGEIVLVGGAVDDERQKAAQELILQHGYHAGLIRKHGAVWIVVRGHDGKWQAISPETEDPNRGVGVLVSPGSEGWYSGLMYDESEAESETEGETKGREEISRKDRSGVHDLIERDCDPSSHVRLDPQRDVNLVWILGFRDLLDGYHYSRKGERFDAFNASQICWAILKRDGYDAKIVTGYGGYPLQDHMWVVVKHPGREGYVAVETFGGEERDRLGTISLDKEYYEGIMYETCLQYSWLHPEKGMRLVPEGDGSRAGYSV